MQNFPVKPIRIVTTEAGSGTDFGARMVAQCISGPLGQQIVVDNVGGAGGTIGAAKGAQAQVLDTTHAIGLALAAGPERWTAMEGGYPIIVDGECIGGIGVSGGNWEFDDRVARAAVESIGAGFQIDNK